MPEHSVTETDSAPPLYSWAWVLKIERQAVLIAVVRPSPYYPADKDILLVGGLDEVVLEHFPKVCGLHRHLHILIRHVERQLCPIHLTTLHAPVMQQLIVCQMRKLCHHLVLLFILTELPAVATLYGESLNSLFVHNAYILSCS